MKELSKDERAARGLAAGIILQAVLDYDAAQKGSTFGRDNEIVSKEELEEFFSSPWFFELCSIIGVNGKVLVKKLYKKKYKMIPRSIFAFIAEQRSAFY